MSIEDQFNAAVEVIKNLPKDGPYQPSAEMKLRFYAFYKQATEGPCNTTKPGFWDIINRTKWDAWNKLGNMPQSEAMENYIEELKKIIETMSFNDKVADFMDALGPFYEIVESKNSHKTVEQAEESVLKCGEILNENNNLIKSLSETLDIHEPIDDSSFNDYDIRSDSYQSCTSDHKSSSHELYFSGSESGDDNIDSDLGACEIPSAFISKDEFESLSKDEDSCYESAGGGTPASRVEESDLTLTACSMCTEVPCHPTSPQSAAVLKDMNSQIMSTLQRLQHDIHHLNNRLQHMESQSIIQHHQVKSLFHRITDQMSRMPIPMFTFLLVWPLVINILFLYYRKYRRR